MSPHVGDTVRVLRDNPNEAEVSANDLGTVTEVRLDGTLKARFKGDRVWTFLKDDVETVPVANILSFLAGDLGIDAERISSLYDETPPLLGIPHESVIPIFREEVTCYSDEDDDEDDDGAGVALLDSSDACDNCAPGPHHHVEGERRDIPFLRLTDPDGDIIDILDTREMTGGQLPLQVRIQYPRAYNHPPMFVNLSVSQAIALAAYLIKTYGPGRPS